MNRSESKYLHTAVRMDEALITLLSEKDFQYITVKEICETAQVNRSTFYLHYETIGDLLEETMEYILDRFLSSFQKTEELFNGKIKEVPAEQLIFINDRYLIPYLQFVYENRKVIQAFVHNPGSMKVDYMYRKLRKHVIDPVMERFAIAQEEREYRLIFYLRGIRGIVEMWIDGGCQESVEKIAEIIEKCVYPQQKRE